MERGYSPGPLSWFLVEFAGVSAAEAAAISQRMVEDWKASPESRVPVMNKDVPKAATAAVPALALLVLTVLAFGVIAYLVIRALISATA